MDSFDFHIMVYIPIMADKFQFCLNIHLSIHDENNSSTKYHEQVHLINSTVG